MLKKLFTNDKFFLVMTVTGFLGLVISVVLGVILYPGMYSAWILNIAMALCHLFLYAAYKKYSKNVMKGLMGAVLFGAIIYTADSFLWNVSVLDYVCSISIFVMAVGLFITHFYINSEHHSKPGLIKLNQIIIIILTVVTIIWNVDWIIKYEDITIKLFCLVLMIGWPCIMATTVCIESRLDAYRLDREAAGWTEEAGYPEGYVHQKDR